MQHNRDTFEMKLDIVLFEEDYQFTDDEKVDDYSLWLPGIDEYTAKWEEVQFKEYNFGMTFYRHRNSSVSSLVLAFE